MSDRSPSATACIADLGCAAKIKSATDTLEWNIGTAGYTAPEILKEERYSLSCDIWSLGVILHLLLTKEFPFWDEDEHE